MAERFFFEVEGERLTALTYRPTKPIGATLLFGQGATVGQHDRFISEYAVGLAERGVLVVTYDFPFTEDGRRNPDREDVLLASCRAAIGCRPEVPPEQSSLRRRKVAWRADCVRGGLDGR